MSNPQTEAVERVELAREAYGHWCDTSLDQTPSAASDYIEALETAVNVLLALRANDAGQRVVTGSMREALSEALPYIENIIGGAEMAGRPIPPALQQTLAKMQAALSPAEPEKMGEPVAWIDEQTYADLINDAPWTAGAIGQFSQRRKDEFVVPLYAAPSVADAMRVEDGWQPIETAPKDGTAVDLWADGGRWPDCRWDKPPHSCGEEGQHCDSDWHRAEKSWVNSFFEPLDDFLFSGPTHWMLPLGPPSSIQTPSEAFAAWLNQGPRLARAAGCHVGIKVTEARAALQGKDNA